jgi:hypothetical protein
MDLLHRCLHFIGIDHSGIPWFIGRFLESHPGI